MAAIGGYTVTVFLGPPLPGPAYRFRELATDGENGVAYQGVGTRPTQVTVRTITDQSTKTNAMVTAEAYIALIGTLVSVTDGRGINYVNVLVKDVRILRIQDFTVQAGGLSGSSTCVLEAEWDLERQA